ncbi:dihydroorotase [Bacillus sp. FJAT-27986]|uniref:dihydroorotase n=1 Tax=Bacillus sp. FJAT-27986 TaxID=1743146 RepID=UPI00080AFC61|nr:dihydroorotase [Bacillus sp. FJAT-27986]OCA89693.1 dihydroorotase [Bacillus sp. FJAT-27986]
MNTIIKSAQFYLEDGTQVTKDILIQNGVISDIQDELQNQQANIIHAKGFLLAPGFIDLHVHLREPGGEHKETIETGTQAAAKGGFTTVAAMPNTRPVPDTAEHLRSLNNRIRETASTRVLPYASITVRELGKELTDFESLKKSGAFAFTDDGVGIQSAGMMLEAMKKAAKLDMTIVAHCEDNSLIQSGCVHEGIYSREHELPGIPSVCEAVHIARDVLLAETTGCHYHVCHISTKESVRTVRDAKKAGIHVTAEVTPHHLLLSEMDIKELDPNFKMNPPLRGEDDKKALLEGLLDGTIDFIATDHAPHSEEEKSQHIRLAPFGIVGLETAFPLLYTYLVKKGAMTLKQLIDFLTIKPAQAFKLNYGKIEIGRQADLVLIDLEEEQVINPQTFLSKGKNTPFAGLSCQGWPVMTIVEGKVVWQKGSLTE